MTGGTTWLLLQITAKRSRFESSCRLAAGAPSSSSALRIVSEDDDDFVCVTVIYTAGLIFVLFIA